MLFGGVHKTSPTDGTNLRGDINCCLVSPGCPVLPFEALRLDAYVFTTQFHHLLADANIVGWRPFNCQVSIPQIRVFNRTTFCVRFREGARASATVSRLRPMKPELLLRLFWDAGFIGGWFDCNREP